MKYPRRYHSAAILLADGSVLMGGDTDGGRDGAIFHFCHITSSALAASDRLQ
jgi:hypothetical protein